MTKTVEEAASEAADNYADARRWISAPKREEIYKAGFRAGAAFQKQITLEETNHEKTNCTDLCHADL